MTIGGVIGEAWGLPTRFLVRVFLLGLVVFATLNLVYALLVEAISSDAGGAAVALGPLGSAIAIAYGRLRESHGDAVPALES